MPITIDRKELAFRAPTGSGASGKILKDLLGARWKKGAWHMAPTSLNVLTLVDLYGDEVLEGAPWVVKHLAMHDWGFTGFASTGDSVKKPLDHRSYRKRALSHPRWEDLYEYQQDCVEYMVCNPHSGCIVPLPPGWGKAPTTIVALDVVMATKVLIVAPLTLARNWQREIDAWSQLYRSWSRATRSMKDPQTECVVTNHEVLFEPAWYDEEGEKVYIEDGWALTYTKSGKEKWIRSTPANMKDWVQTGPLVMDNRKGKEVPARKRVIEPRSTYDQDWDAIVIDESVLLKNRRAVKVDVLRKLTAYAKEVWLLSGSPTTKNRADLYPQCRVIMPRGFKSYWRFAEYFCNVEKGQWGWKVEGDRPDRDPRSYLRDIMFPLDREKAELELPEYIYDPIEVDLNADQAKAFNTMTDEWLVDLKEKGRVTAEIRLAQMTRLAQITSNMVNIGGKRSSAKEDLLLDLIAEEDIVYPLIVWTWWVSTTLSVFDRLYAKTDLAVDYVTGALSGEAKDQALEAYRDGQTDVLVLQMGVGKFGHTLTNTKTLFYHDRHTDSDAYFQSLHRVRRIGLQHRPRIIVPRSTHSFDPAVEANLAGKLESIAKLSKADLRDLLQSLGNGLAVWQPEHLMIPKS